MVGGAGRYDDVDYLLKKQDCDFVKVEGGYLTNFGCSEMDNKLLGEADGNVNICLYENSKIVAAFKCKIKDYDKEEDRIIADIVKQVTTDNMTPFEKMEAVCNYFESKHPKYYPNTGTRLLTLASMPTEPWFETWRFDSMVTPHVLCKAAKVIGGFDKVEDGYSKYYYSNEWDYKHWYAEVTIGNETRSYTFCPMSSTGYMKEIPKINFRDTSKFIRVY